MAGAVQAVLALRDIAQRFGYRLLATREASRPDTLPDGPVFLREEVRELPLSNPTEKR